MRARQGASKASTTTAHKLARIVLYFIKNQKKIDDTVFFEQEQIHQQRLQNRFVLLLTVMNAAVFDNI